MSKRNAISSYVTLALIGGALTACSSEGGEDPEQTEQTKKDPDPLAMPCTGLSTDFEGDDRCILPPESGKGIQLHVGPKDYNDPTEIAKYTLGPYEEKTECYYFTNPSTEAIQFFRQVYRMRPGSHHLIIHTSLFGGTPPPEGWAECYGAAEGGVNYMPIGGTQSGVSEFPPSGEVAPEDANLIRPLNPGAPMKFEMHFVNPSDKPILREAWVNFENKTVENAQILGGLFMIGGRRMNIQVGESATLNYWCDNQLPDRRVVSLFGHRHAHTTRFSVWRTQGDVRELVYEDYDWHETQELIYNSMIENPTPEPPDRPGGFSGQLVFNVGDRLEFECEIDNTQAKNLELQRENPQFQPIPLNFANEVYTGEMCNLFGSIVNNTPPPGGTSIFSAYFWGNFDETVCSPRD